MKLTVAATALASSISATAEAISDTTKLSFLDVVEDAPRKRHRNLAEAMERQEEITSILKERRGLRKENGGIIRRIQRKLASKSLELQNQVSDFSDLGSDDAIDLGLFSRRLQTNSTFEIEEEKNIVEELLELCEQGSAVDGVSCTCSNINVDEYEIDVFCSYNQNSCYIAENSCGGNETFCYLETYQLDVLSPGEGSTKTCYEVSEPVEFQYCYTLIYGGERVKASGCAFEFNGIQCNSCAFSGDECADFDCSNIEEGVGAGAVCGNETVWKKKVQDHLLYNPLPCEGGCNICPGNGEMTDLNTIVSVPTGEFYYCSQLNLAGLFGYLQFVPGDLCNALPPIVAEPCGCTGGVVDPITGEVGNPSSDSAGGSSTTSAATFSKIGFGVTALATSILSWMTA